MKYFVFILTALILLSCMPSELTKEQSEVVYSHKIPLSKSDLKLKILSFVNEKYHSGKAVIQTNDDGIVSGNIVISDFAGNFIVRTSLEYTFIIKYQDAAYKIKCIVKDIRNTDSRQTYSQNPSQWGSYAKEVQSAFDTFDTSLNNYLNEKNSEF